MRDFKFSIILTIIGLGGTFFWGYHLGGVNYALKLSFITLILILMEVSLSFDNAVVNASILKGWNRYWRMLFLTIGMLIAIFGMRLLFPIIIVSNASNKSMIEVWHMALNNPEKYSSILTHHHAEISTFGGIFLLLVFLDFVIDSSKKLHWFELLEKRLSKLGRINTLSIFIALIVIIFITKEVPSNRSFDVLYAGIWGILIYLGVKIIGELLENEHEDMEYALSNIAKGSIGGFIYLEVLDASFSFDGVIGAFAITTDIVTIVVGLGIGAMFVRSLTIYLVRKETLDEYIYLEHGAHYAIGILAILMLIGIKYHIPEVVTGLVGIFFIVLSLYSSKKYLDSL